jgi:hypothetical protein
MVAFYEKVIKIKADVAAVLVSVTHRFDCVHHHQSRICAAFLASAERK